MSPFFSLWMAFALIGLVTVIGTLVMARGLRRLNEPSQKTSRALYDIVVGGAGIAFITGMLGKRIGPQFVLMQAVLVVVTLVFALTLLPRIASRLQGTPYPQIGYGVLVMMIGVFMGVMMRRQGESLPNALLFGGLLSGSGLWAIVHALRQSAAGDQPAPPGQGFGVEPMPAADQDDSWWRE